MRFAAETYCVLVDLHLLIHRQRTPLFLLGLGGRRAGPLWCVPCRMARSRLLGEAVNNALQGFLVLVRLGRCLGGLDGRCGGALPLCLAVSVVKVIPAGVVGGDKPAVGEGGGRLFPGPGPRKETGVPLRDAAAGSCRDHEVGKGVRGLWRLVAVLVAPLFKRADGDWRRPVVLLSRDPVGRLQLAPCVQQSRCSRSNLFVGRRCQRLHGPLDV